VVVVVVAVGNALPVDEGGSLEVVTVVVDVEGVDAAPCDVDGRT